MLDAKKAAYHVEKREGENTMRNDQHANNCKYIITKDAIGPEYGLKYTAYMSTNPMDDGGFPIRYRGTNQHFDTVKETIQFVRDQGYSGEIWRKFLQRTEGKSGEYPIAVL